MSDTGNPVFVLQHHLRQAGAHIAARRYDEAAAHIDRALALDPASLAALTLRDRIEKGRSGRQVARVEPRSPQVATPEDPGSVPQAPARYVPSGVNAASWIDFEQRIQERRYRALVETATRAIARGDGVAARIAIEEARELRPEALEVVQLSGRIALLPAARPEAAGGYLRSRTFRAVSMLLFGVTLLTGLDWVRSESSSDVVDATTSTPPAPALDQLAAAPVDALLPFVDEPTSGSTAVVGTGSPSVASEVEDPPAAAPVDEPPPVEAAPVVNATRAATAAPSTVPAAIPPSGEIPDFYVAPSSRREIRDAAATLPAALPRGEIPDDYVAVAPRREAPPPPLAVSRPAAVPPGPVANVARQPGPIVDPLTGSRSTGTPPAAPASVATPPAAGAAAAIVTPAMEEGRVQSVLQQYARAYGQLDARAAREIWPSVDERALANAFAELESQQFTFDACDIAVNGAAARATCRGNASYVRKIGAQGTRRESRKWQFDLKRDGDAWKIAKAETRR